MPWRRWGDSPRAGRRRSRTPSTPSFHPEATFTPPTTPLRRRASAESGDARAAEYLPDGPGGTGRSTPGTPPGHMRRSPGMAGMPGYGRVGTPSSLETPEPP
eukprot:CAMPEP_0206300542 /NCGR_PEP_ID=MMETSP0106_2-20121207/7754_1 /ASSEMBLY_ACC=CAM_ASM_000206 /TAXON_ID=81532 /ORGANISM="Acanthoeca-like sp., Strain 10tr" /LENGTH=101 /DNA_ID=CAMNT_0053731267 /DNA_START=148 /DNA_END=449 /DNA_ORIENTATION=-